jgi:hypothetical protein
MNTNKTERKSDDEMKFSNSVVGTKPSFFHPDQSRLNNNNFFGESMIDKKTRIIILKVDKEPIRSEFVR